MACERPVFSLAAATSLAAMVVERAALPAFISLTDCSNLFPRSVPDMDVDFLLIFNDLADRSEDMGRNVAHDTLAIND
jgi:hypothetical protein